MENNSNCQKQDIVINFKDLCLNIFLHWRSIIACTLIFAVLLCGCKYVKDSKAAPQSSAAAASLEQLAKGMSAEQLATAKGAVSCKRLFDAHSEYIYESPLFKVPFGSVPTVNLVYNVSCGNAFEAASAFSSRIKSEELYSKMKSAAKAEFDVSYISDFIYCSVASDENAGNNSAAVITVSIHGENKEQCSAMADAAAKFAEDKAAELKKVYPDLSVEKVSAEYSVSSSENIRLSQQNAVNLYNNLRSALKESITLLDSAENAYYDAAVKNLSSDEPIVIAIGKKPSISKKFAVLGAALGFVLSVFWHFAAYLFSRKVKSTEDIKCRYNLFVFGLLDSDTKKKKSAVDRFIIKLFSGRSHADPVKSAERGIALAAEKSGAKKLLVIAGNSISEEKSVLSLTEDLKNSGLNLELAQSPYETADTLDSLASADAVLLVKKIGKSRYEEIYCEEELCRRYGKDLLGIVVLK